MKNEKREKGIRDKQKTRQIAIYQNKEKTKEKKGKQIHRVTKSHKRSNKQIKQNTQKQNKNKQSRGGRNRVGLAHFNKQ